jgi:DNA-binding transcriptional MerR regulator
MYTTKDICDKFGVSRETVRQWTSQFGDYLSPTATPEKGRQRNYTDGDLSVFALVSNLKSTGSTSEEITAALSAGQRGEAPIEAQVVPTSDASLTTLRRDVVQLRQELDTIKTELLMTQGENRLLKQQLDDKEKRIENLYVQLARYKVTNEQATFGNNTPNSSNEHE